jgi:ATP-binding cassette subfamily B protein
VLVAVLAIYVVSAVLSWMQGYVINVIMVRTMWRLREAVEAKINRLPLSYFDKVQRGELISRVTNDIDNITQTMQQSLSTALTNGAHRGRRADHDVLDLVAARARRPRRAAAHGRDLRRHRAASQKAFGTQWRKVGRLNARVEEAFSGHALVKVFGREKDSRRSSRSRTRSSTRPRSRPSSSRAS